MKMQVIYGELSNIYVYSDTLPVNTHIACEHTQGLYRNTHVSIPEICFLEAKMLSLNCLVFYKDISGLHLADEGHCLSTRATLSFNFL